MDLQALASLHGFRAQGEKNANFANKLQYARSHSGCLPTGSKHFPERPWLPGSLLQRKRERTDVWMPVLLLYVWVPPYDHTLRGHCDWKMNSKQAFSSSVWLSAHRMLGTLRSFKDRKASTKSVFAGLYPAGPGWLLRRETSRCAQRT